MSKKMSFFMVLFGVIAPIALLIIMNGGDPRSILASVLSFDPIGIISSVLLLFIAITNLYLLIKINSRNQTSLENKRNSLLSLSKTAVVLNIIWAILTIVSIPFLMFGIVLSSLMLAGDSPNTSSEDMNMDMAIAALIVLFGITAPFFSWYTSYQLRAVLRKRLNDHDKNKVVYPS